MEALLAMLLVSICTLAFGVVATGGGEDAGGAPAGGAGTNPTPDVGGTATDDVISLTKAELAELRKREYAAGAEGAVKERFRLGDPKVLAREAADLRKQIEELKRTTDASTLQGAQQRADALEKQIEKLEQEKTEATQAAENSRRAFVLKHTLLAEISKLQAAKKLNETIPAEDIVQLVSGSFKVIDGDRVVHTDEIGRHVDIGRFFESFVTKRPGYAHRLPYGGGADGGRPGGSSGRGGPASADQELREGLSELGLGRGR